MDLVETLTRPESVGHHLECAGKLGVSRLGEAGRPLDLVHGQGRSLADSHTRWGLPVAASHQRRVGFVAMTGLATASFRVSGC